MRSFVLLLASLAAVPAAATDYTLTLLAPLPFDFTDNGYGISPGGMAVGASNSVSPNAVSWSASGTPTALGSLPGGAFSRANAVNGSGWIAGYSGSPDGRRAVLYAPDGTVQSLGVLPGKSVSEANAISETGWVAGTSGTSASGNLGSQAFRWSEATGMVGLAAPSNGDLTSAAGVNGAGQVVGSTTSGVGCFWDVDGAVTTIGGTSRYTNVLDINEAGRATGTTSADGLTYRAYTWTKAGGMEDIGLLAGYDAAFATSINDAGAVVGFAGNRPDYNQRAFVWTPERGMVDLNSLVSLPANFVLTNAMAINGAGQIVGYGKEFGISERAFLLTPNPVPEPLSIAALGLGAAAVLRRRKSAEPAVVVDLGAR